MVNKVSQRFTQSNKNVSGQQKGTKSNHWEGGGNNNGFKVSQKGEKNVASYSARNSDIEHTQEGTDKNRFLTKDSSRNNNINLTQKGGGKGDVVIGGRGHTVNYDGKDSSSVDMVVSGKNHKFEDIFTSERDDNFLNTAKGTEYDGEIDLGEGNDWFRGENDSDGLKVDMGDDDDELVLTGKHKNVEASGGDGNNDTAKLNGVEGEMSDFEKAIIRQTKGANDLTFDAKLKNLEFNGITFNAADWKLDGDVLTNGDHKYSFADTANLKVKFGTEEKSFADWFGGNATGGGGTTGTLTAVNGDGTDNELTYNGNDIFGKAFDGKGGSDNLITNHNLYDFTNVTKDANGVYTFKNADGKSFTGTGLEKYSFNGNDYTTDQLNSYITNLASTSDTNSSFNVTGTTTDAAQTFGAQNNNITFDRTLASNAGITSINGGAGFDTLNLVDPNLSEQGWQNKYNVQGIGTAGSYTGIKLIDNSDPNAPKSIDLTDLERINVAGKSFTSTGNINDFFQMLLKFFGQ